MARHDGLYQRRGYWYFKYKADGAWHEHATRTRKYAEARKVRNAFLADVEEGKLPNERGRWTLEEAVQQRLTERRHRLAPGSYASEVTITNHLVRILGADTRLDKLADIEAIRRYETARLANGLSTKSINNEVLVLSGLLREANLWRRVESNYKRLPVQKSDIPDALTRDEAYRLLHMARCADDDAVAPYVALLSYATGMRSCEIKRLQIGAIHLDGPHPQIQVRRATTKTNKGARFVALDQMACWAIRKLLDRASRLGATQADQYLLPTRLDRHTRPTDPLHGASGWDPTHPMSSWDAEWNQLRRRAKIAHRRFHDLRHSYVTRAAEAGIPLMVVQAQVGHMSKEMVEHYCHISHAAVHKAAQQIEQQSADLLGRLGLITSVDESTPEEALERGVLGEAPAANPGAALRTQ